MKAKYFNGKTKKINGTTYVLCDQDYALSVPYIRQFHLDTDTEITEREEEHASDTFFDENPDRLYMPFCELQRALRFVTYTDKESNTEYLVYDGVFEEGACDEFTDEVVKKGLEILWKFLTNLNKNFRYYGDSTELHDDATNYGIPSIWFRGGIGNYYTVWYYKCAKERIFFKR